MLSDGTIRINTMSLMPRYIELYEGTARLGSGTGFIVSNSGKFFLVSNRHVIAGRKAGSNEYMDDERRTPTHLSFESLVLRDGQPVPHKTHIALIDSNHEILWLEHPYFRHQIDLVVLPLGGYNGRSPVPAYEIDLHAPDLDDDYTKQFLINAPDPVFVIGYPLDLNGGAPGIGVWVQGTIASDFNFGHGGLPRFLIDSRTRKGLSGSPVFYMANGGTARFTDGSSAVLTNPGRKFLGIYSGRVNKYSDLGWVWHASLISDIVKRGVQGSVLIP